MAPIALQIDFILSVWLKIVPDYAGIFCQLSIVSILLNIAFLPVLRGIISTGENRTFRKVDSFMVMLIFPFTYFGLYFSPIGYVCSRILVNFFRMIYRLLTLRKLTNFSIRSFFNQSLLKCFAVVVVSVPLPLYITLSMGGWQGFLACFAVFFAVFVPSVLFVGLNRGERGKAVKWVREKVTVLFCKE
jgi:hypothetical protein